MKKKIIQPIEQLPEVLNVRLLRNPKTGVWIAEIKNLDVFTEADDLIELIYNVNDLVYAYFDIPKEIQHKIWYVPPFYQEILKQNKPKIEMDKLMKFNILLSPQLAYKC